MGSRSLARDGSSARESARVGLGNSTTRLRLWVSARGSDLLAGLSAFRMARALCCRGAAGTIGDLHSAARAGVGGLGKATAAERSPVVRRDHFSPPALGIVHLCD